MKKLLFTIPRKDFKVQTFCSGGPGGQHQNKTESGVRIIHSPSGAVGESRTHKSQYMNKKEAFKRLTESKTFKLWLNKITYEHKLNKTIDEVVDDMMDNSNLVVEIKENGKWEKCDDKKRTIAEMG